MITGVKPQIHTAVDVPRLRDRLLEGWQSGFLHTLLEASRVPLYFPGDRLGDGRIRIWSIGRWVQFLISELSDPDLPLYFVTRQMTGLVSQAAQGMPYYQVHEDKLPSRSGLVVFGDTVCEVPRERLHPGQQVLINAAFWAPVTDSIGDGGASGLMVVTLQDTDVLLATQPVRADPRALQRVYASMRTEIGPLSYHEEYPMPYGARPYGATEDTRVGNAATAAMICTWTLMGQRITVTRDEPLPRALRRQYTREGRQEPVVRTTTLRQSVHTHQDDQVRDPNASGRVYSKRWVVSEYGYWRNTWYPSKERHEQQFVVVPSYVKGPEGAPLIGGDRVNVLRR